MARLSPEEGFKLLGDRVTQTLTGLFPIVGKKHTLRLDKVEVKDNLDIGDIRSQKEARLHGRSWAVPVEGKVTLVDNNTGRPVDSQTVRLLSLPKHTRRYSHIVNGIENQIDNQWRLKSGVYARIKENGELQSDFNLRKGGRGFDIEFDPATHQFKLAYGTSNIPLAPIMHELGIPHDDIEKRWGKEIATANQADRDQAVAKFYRASVGKAPESLDQARQHLHESFKKMEVRPDTTRITLGKEHTQVTGHTLMDAATKLLHVSQGKAEPDARDALMFKELHSVEDFMAERLQKGSRDIFRRIQNTLDKRTNVRDIVGPNIFHGPIETMYRLSLANKPKQINPLEMISGQMKTTITGEGGIQNLHGITDEAKLVDSSHLGFLDPIHTPEGADTGVNLRLPLGVRKQGHDVVIKMYNVKTGKYEMVNPEKAMTHNVALPDQVNWSRGKPKPIASEIKVSAVGNEIRTLPFKDVTYVMSDPSQMFSVSSNLIPFLPADHPNRSTMAGRHMEQAIPLVHREAPLVRSAIGGGKTVVEDWVGKFAGHTATASGTVTKISKDSVHIKDADGKSHEVQIYNHFPLNDDKSFLHSVPIVKVGDKVKQGQPVVDSNFTKGGTLALGTNLKVGYMPYKGHNFEDGVVISETASRLLTSEHLHQHSLALDKEHILDKNKYQAYLPAKINRDQAGNMDSDGVIKIGTTVQPGDPLVLALRKRSDRSEDRDLARLHRSLVKPYRDDSIRWEADHPGVVQEVVKRGKQILVHVKTQEPAEIGDKVAGRHGNKGIITAIIPDHEMPKTQEGPLHILLNPAGVPGRTNLGQVLETAVAKVALKTGKPFIVQNFVPGADLHAQVVKELKTHGISDKEAVFDGVSGKKLGDALVGTQHILKLQHQVEKKLSARAGGPGYAYDRNLIPKGGGEHGAQSLGALGLYAMLAHGAKANLREMQTVKSDSEQSDEFWAALQAGEPLPAPRPTFAYKKFMGYMNALGLNVKKEGNNLQLVPFTDKQVEQMSHGALPDAGKMVHAKNLKPEAGGLFDTHLTGGEAGKQWTHIKLPEPFPNPVFEKSIQSLLGITGKDFESIIAGQKGLDPKTGKVVAAEHGLTGGTAFHQALGNLDHKKEMKTAQAELANPNLKGNRLDKINRKIKYLRALDSAGMTAQEAYMMQNVPVMPPVFRPISQLPNGDLNTDDVNHMYKGIALSAGRLKAMSPLLPPEEKHEVRAEVYDGLRSLTGLGGHLNRKFRGILDVITGQRPDKETGEKVGAPKYGYFQDRLVKRKQDMSMRSTIIPDPGLGLDEVGLPRKAAVELYKPFIVRELRTLAGMTPLQAQDEIKNNTPLVDRALERVITGRPILLKRDPVLHKYGVQAFKPRIVGGKAVQIHPLVTSGFNADFDGDTMSAFVPISNEAVAESHKMFPSNNLFGAATGNVMYTPTHEALLGLYGITKPGDKTNKSYKNIAEVEEALNKGEINLNHQVKVGGMANTVGKFLVGGALPEPMRRPFLTQSAPLDKKGQQALLTQLAKDHPTQYATAVDKLKDFGNRWSTETAFSIGLDDIKPEKELRSKILKAADKAMGSFKSSSQGERDKKAVQIYDRATTLMHQGLQKMTEQHSSLITMNRAGVKPSIDTLRQIKMAPMLIMNAKGEIIPTPATKSYAEGLDLADYWTSMSGARKGIIQKVQSVQEPGYVTKMIMNTVMDNLIVDHDCGTDKGVALSIDEKDILDRHLAVDHKAGKHIFKAGTIVTPDVRTALRNNKVGRIVVRSPLRCQHGPGICQRCFGLTESGKHPEIGTNIGVLAGQSLGERATQLAMKAFHCNHGDSLVFVRSPDDRVLCITMSDLFQFFEEEVTWEGEEELAATPGWRVWDGRWVEMTHVRRHRQDRPMVLVSADGMATICQDNHPVGVYSGSDLSFVEAGNLVKGDLLHKDLFLFDLKGATFPDLNPYFVGMFLAEGCVVWKRSHASQKEQRPYQIQISQRDGVIRKRLLDSTKGMGAVMEKERYIAINNVEMGQRFHNMFGRYSRFKRLPPEFLWYADHWLASCLCGLIDGDGTIMHYVDGPDAIAIDTTSFALAQQVVMLCLRLGVRAGIVATTRRKLTRHQGYQVRLRMTEEACRILDESEKVSKIDKRSPTQQLSYRRQVKVTNVREVMYTHDHVYDVTTETGTLYVSGIKHHNTGGTAATATGLVDEFSRVKNLLLFPAQLPGSATLSTVAGRVEKVQKDPAGGHNVFIGGVRHYVPQDRGVPHYDGSPIKPRMEIKKGTPISAGPINPHEMLPLTGIEAVQGHLSDELHKLYASEGIRRRNHEVVVKAMTSTTKVEDPGDHHGFLRGDFAPAALVANLNRTAPKGSKPIVHKPILRGVNVLPLEMHEDWIARLNHERLQHTVMEAAQKGWTSKIHGAHPIPAIVHGAEIGKGKHPWEY